MFLRGFPLGASKGFRHSDEIVALGLCYQAGEGEQFATLFLCEAREVRAICFYCPQYSYGRAQVVI
jgi:hypothetical protein